MWKITLTLVVFLVLVGAMLYFLDKIEKGYENLDKIKSCAVGLYEKAKQEGMNFSSQCLGTCGDFAVDIVHVPRNKEDDKPENQCNEYLQGKVTKFIELDKEGAIVRISK